MILQILIGWTALSIPAGLFLGALMRSSDPNPLPLWGASDDRHLNQWAAHAGRRLP